MKIVVTGGAGFIGSHVTEHFSRNNQVVVCDNLSRSKTLHNSIISSEFNRDYLQRKGPRIEFHNVDIRNLERLREVSKSANVIIHTAGQVAVRTSILNPIGDFEVNTLGTVNVLETARLNDAMVLFC